MPLLTAPPGTEGIVMDVKVFSRRDRLSKTDDELVEEATRIKDIHHDYKDKEAECTSSSMRDSVRCFSMRRRLLLSCIAKQGKSLLEEGADHTRDARSS